MQARDDDFPHLARAGVERALGALPGCRRLVVALSGGLDSTALLHALATGGTPHGLPLAAVHVDHGLQAGSAKWTAHCAALCRSLAVPFVAHRLAARPPPGASLEAWARTERYAVLGAALAAGEALLTAHHLDDQAETFLLQALRGAGPLGLRGIAACRPLGAGWLVRPLLAVPRATIRAYAEARGLAWIEDPSNADPALDRNWLRREIMPALARRRAAHAANLARAAGWQAEAARQLEAAADALLGAAAGSHRLPLELLAAQAPELRGLLLRRWLARAGAPLPDARQLAALERGMLAAERDRVPDFHYKGWRVRRYRGQLELAPREEAVPDAEPRVWRDLERPLAWHGGELRAVAARGRGIRAAAVPTEGLVVRARRGGERCRPADRAHGQTLKRLLQESGVPPWRRAELPLVCVGEDIAAVADLWVCAGFAAAGDEPGWVLEWRPACERAQRRGAGARGTEGDRGPPQRSGNSGSGMS